MNGFMRQRGDAWQLWVFLGEDPVTGKKRYVNKTVRCGKREAQRMLASMVTDAERGLTVRTAEHDAIFAAAIVRDLAEVPPEFSRECVAAFGITSVASSHRPSDVRTDASFEMRGGAFDGRNPLVTQSNDPDRRPARAEKRGLLARHAAEVDRHPEHVDGVVVEGREDCEGTNQRAGADVDTHVGIVGVQRSLFVPLGQLVANERKVEHQEVRDARRPVRATFFGQQQSEAIEELVGESNEALSHDRSGAQRRACSQWRAHPHGTRH
jgi:hypothetical protein